MLKHAALFALALLLVACIGKAPDYVIGRSRMERVLYDYLLAQAMAEQGGGDVEARQYEYVEAVYRKHGITAAEFDSSMVWYSRDAGQLYEMYTNVSRRLERDGGITATEDNASMFHNLRAEGDTANIWTGGSFLALVGDEVSNLERFTIKADTSYRAGDYYRLVFDPYMIGQEAYVLTCVTYEGDSTFTSVQRITAGFTNAVEVPQNDLKTRQLRFTFYMPEAEVGATNLLCLMNVALARFRKPAPEPIVEPADSLE